MLLRRTIRLRGLAAFHRQRALLQLEREVQQRLALLGRESVCQHAAAIRLEAQFGGTFHGAAV